MNQRTKPNGAVAAAARRVSVLALCGTLALGLGACSVPGQDAGTTDPAQPSAQEVSVSRDGATTVALADGATSVDGPGVSVNDDVVTIAQGGTYVMSGTLTNGRVVVDADGEDVALVLSGASVTSSNPCALEVSQAKQVVVELDEGTENKLADGGDVPADGDPDACLYSKADLVVQGSGSLEVTAGAKDAVTSKDTLAILGAKVSATAPDHGIEGKDSLVVDDGATVEVKAEEGDALRSDGDLVLADATTKLEAGDDAVHTEGALSVSAGTHTVTACTEGLEGATVAVSGGTVDITSTDDGINAAADAGPYAATFSGGEVKVVAGGDAIDSNGTIEVSGGTVVAGSTGNGDGALDFVDSCTVSGGTLIAAGGGMAEAPSSATQPVLMVGFGSTVAAGSTVKVSAGNTEVASLELPVASNYAVLSAPDLEVGAQCTVTWDGGSAEASVADGVTSVGQAVAGQGAMGGGMGPGGAAPDGGAAPNGAPGSDATANGAPEPPSGTAPEPPSGSSSARPDGMGPRSSNGGAGSAATGSESAKSA